MNLALEQAKKMLGNTKENPSVGCVITKNNQVVGAGTTGFNGRPHAEYNALKLNKLKKCNLYVTLEPCTHYGKTPPCVNNIKKNKIKKVFFAIYDPDLRTYKKSHVYFKKNEIKVKTKILHKKINEFYKSYSKSIPRVGKFIIGKSEPYEYLIDSIEKFYSQKEFFEELKKQNFYNISYRNLSGGIVAIHSAWKV